MIKLVNKVYLTDDILMVAYTINSTHIYAWKNLDGSLIKQRLGTLKDKGNI